LFPEGVSAPCHPTAAHIEETLDPAKRAFLTRKPTIGSNKADSQDNRGMLANVYARHRSSGNMGVDMVPAESRKPGLLWGIRISSILWFLGCIIFLLGLPIVLQASPLILVGIVLVAGIIAGLLAGLVARVRGGRVRHRWAKGIVAGTFVLTALAASPVYYAATFTQFSPAMVPQAVLSNGQKKIVFHGMQHVGTEVFFKTVVYDLEDALSRGSVAYYEGVRPSTPADDAWFASTITGGADLSAAYRDLSEVCGLHFQGDYFGLLGRDVREHPAAHVVADVDTAQLHTDYNRLMVADAAFARAMRLREVESKPDGTNGLERLVDFLRKGTPGQREIGATLCRGYMTFATRRAAIRRTSSSPPSPITGSPMAKSRRRFATACSIPSFRVKASGWTAAMRGSAPIATRAANRTRFPPRVAGCSRPAKRPGRSLGWSIP
jgi:hypothetical protein